jgi:hypothetical protein
MACQSTISSTFKNISQAKARAPGVLSKVVATVVCMACIAVASASSIMSLAWVIFHRGLVCSSVLSTLVTVWCILSQIALDWAFLLAKHTYLMLKISNSHWKFCPMNSPPLSCRHQTGWGYQQSQLCVNLSRMWLAVFLSTQISLTRFEAISMQVNALHSTCQPWTFTFHGPIKLMVTSSQFAICTYRLGRRP